MPAKQHILFVDDEPKILRGLRRNLDSMIDEWAMTFATGGAEALEWLAQNPCDVIVTDMRMPGIDGAALLTEVRERYPHIIRFILSGQTDKKEALYAAGLAHQFLSKPCDTDTLKLMITRACALHTILASAELKHLVLQLKTLPSFPSSYRELMAELQSPDTSTKKVGQIISRDIAMTAKILQLVNSAFFGLPQHIGNPTQAAILLGIDTIKSLALSVQVFSQFDTASLGKMSLHALQKHSLSVGILAKRIARAEGFDPRSVDHAFIAGMLHDVGKLIMAANLPQKYDAALISATDDRISLPEAEIKVFGATHAQVGAYLLGLWGLPDNVVEAVAFHHAPAQNLLKPAGILTAVYAANVLINEFAPASTQIASGIDPAYLNIPGVADKLAEWRTLYTGLWEGADK